MIHSSQRGFTLLIAIILSTVALVMGLALADAAYKQVVLSSSAKQSQVAFYAADSALECALYYDQQFVAFAPGGSYPQGNIRCESRQVTNFVQSSYSGGSRLTTFTVPCAGGGVSASVSIYKQGSGTCGSNGATSCLYATGYNTCNASDPNRFERGLKVLY